MPDDIPDKKNQGVHFPNLSSKLISQIADEVAKTLIVRLPHAVSPRRKKKPNKHNARYDHGLFLDTSAIIDGRIFDVITLGLLTGSAVVIPESILLELKHIADSQDMVKRSRGQAGLAALEKLKKSRKISVYVMSEDEEKKYTKDKIKEVDERLIKIAKNYKGRLITCDYNLEKKGSIEGVTVINMYALSQVLKVQAVPGEALHVKVLHPGKDLTQGVGYLDDGTMIVIEQGSIYVGKSVDVVVARIIQTAAGRILFAKKI